MQLIITEKARVVQTYRCCPWHKREKECLYRWE